MRRGGRIIGFIDYTDNIINNFKIVSKLCHFYLSVHMPIDYMFPCIITELTLFAVIHQGRCCPAIRSQVLLPR